MHSFQEGTADGSHMLKRLKERKVVQWALAYLAGAWLVLEVAEYVSDAFGWPTLVLQLLLAAAVVGLFVTLVLAWYHGEKGRQRVGGAEIVLLAVILAIGGFGMLVLRQRSSAVPVVSSADAFSPPSGSIAVLPFRDMSPGRDHAWFAEGVAEEILAHLTRIGHLRVVGRASSFLFQDRTASIPEIGRALNVATVLDGSVRREGDEVRISVELVGTRDGFRRWVSQYDRRLENILSVQQAIARAVTEQLEIELGPRESERLAGRDDPDPEAYDLYLRGLHLRNRPAVNDNLRRSVERFRQAVALDSTFAAAWAALSAGYITLGQFRLMEPVEAYGLAERYARRALELDPMLADAHHAVGLVRWSRDYDYEGAEQAFRRAIELAPNDWKGHHGLAFVLQRQGQSDEALASARHELELDPLGYWPRFALSEIHYRRREFDKARRHTEAMMEMVPGDPTSLAFLALVLAHQGSPDSAALLVDSARAIAPGNTEVDLTAALALAVSGDRHQARSLLDSVLSRTEDGYVSPGFVGAILANLGEIDSAFVALERARLQRDSWMLSLDYPALDPLRDDPRFERLAEPMIPTGTR